MKGHVMRKILTIGAVATLAAVALAPPTAAQARFGAGAIADAAAAASSVQPAQYYGGYGYRYYRPRYYGGGYYDYRRYGYPGSRDALDTCAYC
jgi:hypothetical protein